MNYSHVSQININCCSKKRLFKAQEKKNKNLSIYDVYGNQRKGKVNKKHKEYISIWFSHVLFIQYITQIYYLYTD